MPYTFGAATSDRITVSGVSSGQQRNGFFSAWIRPTTLTATRHIMGIGGHGPRIDTTTSEFRYHVSQVTTDAQYTSSGAGLAVDVWTFFFFLFNHSASTSDVDLFVGTVDTPPQQVPLTLAVTGVGNCNAPSTVVIGNNSNNNVAFQGDIAHARWAIVNGSLAATTHPYGLTTAASTTAEQLTRINEALVTPLWMGNSNPHIGQGQLDVYNIMQRGEYQLDRDALGTNLLAGSGGTDPQAGTITGATVSANGAPRPNIGIPKQPSRRR